MTLDLQAFFWQKGKILIQSRCHSAQMKTAKSSTPKAMSRKLNTINKKTPALMPLRHEDGAILT